MIASASPLLFDDLASVAGVSVSFLSALGNGKPSVLLDTLLRGLNALNLQLVLRDKAQEDAQICRS